MECIIRPTRVVRCLPACLSSKLRKPSPPSPPRGQLDDLQHKIEMLKSAKSVNCQVCAYLDLVYCPATTIRCRWLIKKKLIEIVVLFRCFTENAEIHPWQGCEGAWQQTPYKYALHLEYYLHKASFCQCI